MELFGQTDVSVAIHIRRCNIEGGKLNLHDLFCRLVGVGERGGGEIFMILLFVFLNKFSE